MATKKRLIDADVLDDAVQVSQHCNPHTEQRDRAMHNHEHLHFRVLISQAPTVDAVEVVRCKYCRHRTENGMCYMISGCPDLVGVGDDFFCAYGERKVDAG